VKRAEATGAPPPPPLVVAQPGAPQRGSFLQVASDYLAGRDDLSPATRDKHKWLLQQLAVLHTRPIGEITRPEYVRAVVAIQDAGPRQRRESAHRCGMLLSSVSRYACNAGLSHLELPVGWLRGTLKPVKTVSYPAITDPKLFGQMLRAIDTYHDFVGHRFHDSVCSAMQLAPLVFVRPGELRHMEWSELNFERAEWVIPATKTKMRRPHLVPLTPQALAIINERKGVATGKYVFPTNRDPNKPLSENAWRDALDAVMRMIKQPRQAHTVHGFRSSASTMLREQLKYDSSIVELQMAHRKRDKVASIYDRSEHVEDRRAMMVAWANYLDKLRAEARAEG
jgi:integrase